MNYLLTDNVEKLFILAALKSSVKELLTFSLLALKETELFGKVELHLYCDWRFKMFSKKLVPKVGR